MQLRLTLLAVSAICNAASIRRQGSTCSDVVIPVSIQAANLAIPAVKNAAELQTIMNDTMASRLRLAPNTVGGTYNIKGTFCEPETVVTSRASTIQLLVHGITYTREYWTGQDGSGQSFGNQYSWVDYASKQGYPTLAIDRLGNGLSDRPSGTAIVQLFAQVEVTHALVQALRSGQVGGRSFSKVIYAGHSYGSLIGNSHSATYPGDVDAYVLTGYTSKLKLSILNVVLAGGFIPAALAVPSRFAGQAVDYFAATNQAGTNSLFFTNAKSDPAFRQSIFKNRGTVTVGEFVTAFLSGKTAPTYNGDVFLLTGKNDAIFCSADLLGLGTLIGRGNCGSGPNGLVERTQAQYPAASNFDFFVPAGIGHCNIQHFGAEEQFEAVHDWLQGVGY